MRENRMAALHAPQRRPSLPGHVPRAPDGND